MSILFIMFFVCYLVQQIFTYFQVSSISKLYAQLARKYEGDYFIGINNRKKLKPTIFCMVVIDSNGNLLEAYAMEGLLVHERLKALSLEGGMTIFSIKNEEENVYGINKKILRALQEACGNVLKQYPDTFNLERNG